MSLFEPEFEAPTPLTICPKCGRQVRIDGHCDCEAIFLAKPRK